MLILGLGRSAMLCNMLKLMRCNKWANPPKACPLWQKHKAFRQAWRPLCSSPRRTGSSQWVSISLRETLWTWLIVGDVCPGSLTRGAVGQIGGSERGSGCGEFHKQSLTMCTIRGGLERNIWSGSGLLCRMCTYYTHIWMERRCCQFIFDLIQEMKIPQTYDVRGFSNKVYKVIVVSVDFLYWEESLCIFCLSQSDETHAFCKNAHSLCCAQTNCPFPRPSLHQTQN